MKAKTFIEILKEEQDKLESGSVPSVQDIDELDSMLFDQPCTAKTGVESLFGLNFKKSLDN